MYTISGDMFRGSIIDSEHMGLSTAMIINELKPDAVCRGREKIELNSTQRFNRIFADHSMLCSSPGPGA